MAKITTTEREFDDGGRCIKETVTETESVQTYYPALPQVYPYWQPTIQPYWQYPSYVVTTTNATVSA